jgi:HK97 family phage major capsid protein
MDHQFTTIYRALAQHYGELAGCDAKPAPRFSLGRVIKEMSTERGLHDGYEREICGGAALMAGEHHDPHRVVIPFGALARRDMNAHGIDGGYLIGSATPEPVDILRTYSVTAAAGITVLSGLRENLTLPRVSAAPSGGWIAEDGVSQYTESQPTIGSTSMTPKHVATLVDYTHTMNRQVEILEPFLRQQMFGKIGQLIDTAFFAGSGSSGQPSGLLLQANIGTQAGAAFDDADAIAMRATALTAGAREDALQWVGPPAVQALLAARFREAGSGRRLWESDGILGRPANASTLAPASTLVAGDFSKAIFGLWGAGFKLEIDPYTAFTTGKLTARVVVSLDFAFPMPSAFVVATSVS